MNNFSSWGEVHKKIAKKHLKENRTLPSLPTNILDWILVARPKVEGKKRNFLATPFWVPIYQDTFDFQMIIGGRQIYKSTCCTDFIAAEATIHSGVQVCYITHDHGSLSAFSKQKLRIGTFLTNPVLSKFLRHPGNVGEISLKNNSTIYLVTDNYQYRHLEGKSPTICILDEAQYQDLEFFGKIHQTMMATKGKTKIFGIGGKAGSHYEKLWQQTDQREWLYDDPDWRKKLRFDNNGLIVDQYLKDVLCGKWVSQNNSDYIHGYHIPQTLFATIPLTESDAVEKYKIHPRFSIEYQKKTLSGSLFNSHVLGMFYNSANRPITRDVLLKCTSPYRYLSLLKSNETSEIKNTFGEQVEIAMGVDFGSGTSSHTAIAIIILWKKTKRIQLVHVEKRPPENQLRQSQYIANLFHQYSCDIGVGDLGYGANQIKIIQDGGYSVDSGKPFEGVSDEKFYGCRTISDFTRPFQIFDDTVDEHGDQIGRIQIDKTSSIDGLIDTINRVISYNGNQCSKLIIPSRNDYETNFLLNDLISVSKKEFHNPDTVTDPRQRPKKEYNHPPDSVMALIYAISALKITEEIKWNWISA